MEEKEKIELIRTNLNIAKLRIDEAESVFNGLMADIIMGRGKK